MAPVTFSFRTETRTRWNGCRVDVLDIMAADGRCIGVMQRAADRPFINGSYPNPRFTWVDWCPDVFSEAMLVAVGNCFSDRETLEAEIEEVLAAA